MNNNYIFVANIVTELITCISFILCFINAYFFNKINKYDKALSLYIIFCFLFDLTNNILIKYKIPNIGLLPLFNTIEIILLLCFFYTSKKYKSNFILIFISSFVINVCEIYTYFVQNNEIINSGRIYNALIFISIILYKLYNHTLDLKNLWLSYIMLLYFTVTFIQFLLLDFLVKIPDTSIFITWSIYAISCSMLYIKSTHYIWKNMKI